jgi:hypothetical protein
MAKLRDADTLLLTAVKTTIGELALDDVDLAAVKLAEHYAQAIDAGHCSECDADRDLEDLGHRLLAVLDALGATPAARSKIRKGVATSDGPSRLSALRAARPG